jgi:uncharacterized integral membrane protein
VKRVRTFILVVLGILGGLSLAVFVNDNRAPIELQFLRWRLADPIPVWLFAAVCALSGYVLPKVLFWGFFWERFKERWELKRKVSDLEKEVLSLRNMPLKDLPPITAAPDPVPSQQPRLARGRMRPDRPEPGDSYEDFLGGESDDEGPQQPELLPREEASMDPYAAAFEKADPSLEVLEDAEIYVAVRDSSTKRGEG